MCQMMSGNLFTMLILNQKNNRVNMLQIVNTKSKITFMDKDESKLGWGGKRVNQTGRPPLPSDKRRVMLQARVAPETKKWFDGQKDSTGKIIDRMVAKQKS